MHLLNAILAAIAYRGLVTLSGQTSVSEEVAEWFFLPTDTAPAAVLAISLWLVFRRRQRLLALPRSPGPLWLSLPLLLAGAGMLVWSVLVQAPDLLAPSLMFSMLGYACLCAGAPAVRILLLPAVFLLFAVPVPAPLLSELVFRLQIWTANYAGWLLFAIGVPALVSGEVVAQAEEAFKVIETCSGFRSIATLMMLALVLADLFRRPAIHTLLLLASAPPIAFFINGFRVVGLILNPHSEIAEVHDLQGVAILLAGLVLLYAADGVLARLLPALPASAGDPSAGSAAPTDSSGARSQPWLVSALAASLAIGSLWLPHFEPWEAPVRFFLMDPFKSEMGDWRASRREIDRVFLGTTGFGDHTHQRFVRPGEDVDLFVAVGNHPSRRERSVFSPKVGLPAGGWRVEEQNRVRLGKGGPWVTERVARSGQHLRLVYHWYGGTPGRGYEIFRALFALDRGPFPRTSEAYAIRIGTPLIGRGPRTREQARNRLKSFYSQLRLYLERLEADLSGKPLS